MSDTEKLPETISAEQALWDILMEETLEEALKENYPDITAEEITEMKQKCKNPWDAVILYGLTQFAKANG